MTSAPTPHLKIHTAAKDHVCDLCQGKIPKGHRYWRGEDGQYYYAYKEHTNCEMYKPEFSHQIQ